MYQFFSTSFLKSLWLQKHRIPKMIEPFCYTLYFVLSVYGVRTWSELRPVLGFFTPLRNLANREICEQSPSLDFFISQCFQRLGSHLFYNFFLKNIVASQTSGSETICLIFSLSVCRALCVWRLNDKWTKANFVVFYITAQIGEPWNW